MIILNDREKTDSNEVIGCKVEIKKEAGRIKNVDITGDDRCGKVIRVLDE